MKYLLLILISGFFFTLTYASAPGEFTGPDLGFLAFLLTGVFGVEILVARLFARYRFIQNLLLAGFATANILYLNLVLNQDFMLLPRYGHILGLLLSLFILTTFMNMLDENTRVARILPTLFALSIVGVLTHTFLSIAPVSEVLTAHGKTSAKNIQVVDFKTRPNVYFINFDALTPKAIVQKYLGVETTPYLEVMDPHFRRFRNFFADRTGTKPSLNSLLALDIEHYTKAQQNNTEHYFFPGLIPSPLLDIFKYNGYETTTTFESKYFGGKKGVHVDNYLTSRWSFQKGVCQFIDTYGFRAPVFLGYCLLAKSKLLDKAYRKVDALHEKSRQSREIDFLMNNMRAGLQKDRPQFMLAHVDMPHHAPNSFNIQEKGALDTFKQVYLRRSEQTAEAIKKIVAFVTKEDPEAIVYVFGDHGLLISKGVSFEDDPIFYVQDNYGAYGGIFPRDRCAESFATPYSQDFMTLLQGAHMIIRCLSGGDDAFLTMQDYRLPDPVTIDQNRYENYLYE